MTHFDNINIGYVNTKNFDGYVMAAERLNTPCITVGITENVKQLGSFKTESFILTRIVLKHSWLKPCDEALGAAQGSQGQTV